MGKRKHGARRYKSGRLIVDQTVYPNERVQELLARFAWHRPTGSGRSGRIDQDICDAVGQLQVCDLLYADGVNPIDMRDRCREWKDRNGRKFVFLETRGNMPDPIHDRAPDDDEVRVAMTEEDEERAELRYRRLDSGVTSAVRDILIEANAVGLPTGSRYLRWWEELVAEHLQGRGIATPNAVGPSMGDRAKLAILNEALAEMVGKQERAA